MSKKSRKRNKKILGVLGALGAAALLARKGTAQGVSGSDKAKFTSNPEYTGDVTGTNYPGANKVVAAPIKKPINNTTFRTRHKVMDSAGNTIPSVKKQSYVAKHSAPKNVMGPFDYMQPAPALKAGNLRGFTRGLKDGGRVGCGKAKRGFGRALKKGRK